MLRTRLTFRRIASLALLALTAVFVTGAFAAGPSKWTVKTAKGKTATGVFNNGANQKVVSVSAKGGDPNKDPIVSFTFDGVKCALDKQGGAECATVSVAPGKTAKFSVTTKLAIAKNGFQGCTATSQPAPPQGTNPAPAPGGGQPQPPTGGQNSPLQCQRAQFHSTIRAPHHSTRPKPTATVRAHLRKLLATAITNQTHAIADLKANHTTAARGALIKAIAALNSIKLVGASYDLSTVNRDIAASAGGSTTVLNQYTESPTAAERTRAVLILRNAIADEKSASKLLLK